MQGKSGMALRKEGEDKAEMGLGGARDGRVLGGGAPPASQDSPGWALLPLTHLHEEPEVTAPTVPRNGF